MRSRGSILGLLVVALSTHAASGEEPFSCGPDDRIASDAPSVAVERIDVASAPVPAVILELSDPAEPLARMLEPTGRTPARIYVDVPNARFEPAAATARTGRKPILRVRSGQFGATARIVVELSRPTSYAVGVSGRTVTIALDHPDPIARKPVRVARHRASVPAVIPAAPEVVADATAVPDACLVDEAPPPREDPAPAPAEPLPPPEPVHVVRPVVAPAGAERLSVALEALGAAGDPLLRRAASVLGRAVPATPPR